ncbi:MAG: UDP-N-acetylmuramyl-tripeptide synthetase, partial [Pseudomonadota bacterium]
MTLPGGQPRPNVAALLEGLVPAPALAAVVRGVGAAPVAGLTDDSRAVQPGMVFVAIRGDAHDGHRFADAAVSAGAILVLAERALPDCAVPVLVVPELASRRSELAGRLWGHPSAALDLIAVTGTNGKTSVAHYSCQLLDHFGERCGYLGTIGWGPLDALRPARLTTADAMGMQERLAQLRQDGCTAVALEASSHALAQDRLRALTVDSAVFTNLSRDHLDYHGSMAAYAAAKARLFERAELQQLVLNGDDAFGQELLSRVAGTAGSAAPSLDCYGASRPAGPCDRYLGWESLELHATGIRGRWYGSWGTCAFELPLLGAFAVANVAAALLAVLRQHDDLARAVSHLAALQGVPGRMESFVRAGAPTVVVDYAHTPDALAHALQALRAHGAASL